MGWLGRRRGGRCGGFLTGVFLRSEGLGGGVEGGGSWDGSWAWVVESFL